MTLRSFLLSVQQGYNYVFGHICLCIILRCIQMYLPTKPKVLWLKKILLSVFYSLFVEFKFSTSSERHKIIMLFYESEGAIQPGNIVFQ